MIRDSYFDARRSEIHTLVLDVQGFGFRIMGF